MIELLKAVLFGIVEGITEWLPVSSTGHMILLNELVQMDVSEEFWSTFLVVIQLGAILAVILTFWNRIWPLRAQLVRTDRGVVRRLVWRRDVLRLWVLILIACIPAGVVGVVFGDWLDEHLENWIVVSIMLIAVGIAFIVIENMIRGQRPAVTRLRDLTVRDAVMIGLFQLIAAVLPGTSRSGATILGGLLIGIARPVAAEFTFILAIPIMAGASLLKLIKYGFSFSVLEFFILLTGMAVAFIVSMLSIRLLLSYIRSHDFKVFGWYRIVLGIAVIAFFLATGRA